MDLDTSILIVDDDDGIRGLISDFLQKHGYRTDTAADARTMRAMLAQQRYDLIVLDVMMRAMLAQQRYDLIVLDVMMPREDGLTALRQLGPDAPPVIMLSAVGSDIDRIVGLEMGADDYLAKPCNPRELLARIRTVLRREARAGSATAQTPASEAAPADPAQPVLHFAGWQLDIGMRLLIDPAGQTITLTDGEFRLMRAFAEHPRRVLTRDQLLDWSRGEDSDQFDRAIDVQLSRLRRKLSMGEGGQDVIRTIRNEGYLFQPVVTQRAG